MARVAVGGATEVVTYIDFSLLLYKFVLHLQGLQL